VFQKKQPLCFLVITSPNINRFSKFFHRTIPKKTDWVYMIVNFHLTLVMLLHYLVKLENSQNKCSNFQSECSKCPLLAAMQAVSRAIHWSHCQALPGPDGPIPPRHAGAALPRPWFVGGCTHTLVGSPTPRSRWGSYPTFQRPCRLSYQDCELCAADRYPNNVRRCW